MLQKKRTYILAVLLLGLFIIQVASPVGAIYIPPDEDPPTKYRVTGTVRDAETNAYVSGATVKVYTGLTYRGQTSTSTTGYFNMYIYSTAPIFFFTVKITRLNYEPTQATEEVLGTTAYFGTLYMTPIPPQDPPESPDIINVQTTVNGLDDVSISWDVVWDGDATAYETKLWWGEDSVFTGVTPIIHTSGDTHHTVNDLPVGYVPNVYWYKIEASNSNSAGTAIAIPVGPFEVTLKHFPTDDSFTYAEVPGKNYDSDAYWYNKLIVATGDHESPGLFKGWLKFNIDNPEFITQATLRAYIYGLEPNGHGTITAYETGTNWEEETITYSSSQSISVGMALSSDSSGSAGSWDSWDVTSLAQRSTVISILLAPSGGNLLGAHYYSREYSTVALRPYLEIQYSDGLSFYDECSAISTWGNTGQYYLCPYSPLSHGKVSYDYNLVQSGDSFRLNDDTGSSGDIRGRVYNKALSQPIALSDLERFEVDLSYIYQSDFRQGSIIVSLYDDVHSQAPSDTLTKPIVVGELFVETEYGSTPELDVNAYYVDEDLNEFSTCLKSHISQSWSDRLAFWCDNDGVWADIIGDTSSPILLRYWNQAEPRRMITHVVIQGLGMGSNIPVLSIDHLQVVTRNPLSYLTDLNPAIEHRSGPNDIPLAKPGPTNEIQFFPSNGESLKFEFYRTAAFYDIILDLRPIAFVSSPNEPQVRIKVNGEIVDVNGEYSLNMGPVQSTPFVNYLHTSRWTSLQMGFVTLEVSVTGWDNGQGIVALRGIWVLADVGGTRLDTSLGQIFPDSNELLYYVPMGHDTNLELGWEGDGGIEVSVDNHVICWTDQHTIDLDLASYPRGSYRELKLRYTGILEGVVNTMHTSHFWMNIEVDYIDYTGIYSDFPSHTGYSDFGDYLFDLWTDIQYYYADYTHGRILFTIDSVIPYNDNTRGTWGDPIDPTVDPCYGHYTVDLVDLGEQYFSHRTERNYVWAVYIANPFVYDENDDLCIAGGYLFDSDAKHDPIYDMPYPNKRNAWTGISAQWHHYPATSFHELGHLAHMMDDACSTPGCVMGGPELPHGNEKHCNYHWFQNYLSNLAIEYRWSHDWWLL